jgi:outer membrane protein OmpA-like peptidoglycan-associated protein
VLTDYSVNKQTKLQMGIRYLVGRELIGSLEFTKDNFAFGAAYDLSASKRASANSGAVEFGVKLKGLVKTKSKNKKKRDKRGKNKRRPQSELSTIRAIVNPISLKSHRPMPRLNTSVPRTQFKLLPVTGIAKAEQNFTYNYALNKYSVRTEFKKDFDQIVDKLLSADIYFIIIDGHTDSTGSTELNANLSQIRAQGLADYLISLGLSAKKIKVTGKGEAMPISSNDSAMGRSMNRRVEISVIR